MCLSPNISHYARHQYNQITQSTKTDHNRLTAVSDTSIWMHSIIKAIQDDETGSRYVVLLCAGLLLAFVLFSHGIDIVLWLDLLNNTRYPHLKAFFYRVCKLLFYGVKPVFVFDGGVPYLKYKTIVSYHCHLPLIISTILIASTIITPTSSI